MERLKWIQICFLFFVCIGVGVWATHASCQQRADETTVGKEMEKVMQLPFPRSSSSSKEVVKTFIGNALLKL